MALGINEVFQESLAQLNKNQNGGYTSGDEYTRAAKRAQVDWFNDKYKLYESSYKNTDDMQVLKVPAINLPFSNGVANLPSDYFHFDKAKFRYYIPNINESHLKPVDLKGEAEEDYGFFKPTIKYPSIEIKNGTITIEPTTIPMIQLEYLRLPTDPVWGYTVDGDGIESYDSATSTDFEVPDYAFTDMVSRIVTLFEAKILETEMMQYTIPNENRS